MQIEVNTATTVFVGLSGLATFFSGIMFAWLRLDVKKVASQMEALSLKFSEVEKKVTETCGILKGKGILQ